MLYDVIINIFFKFIVVLYMHYSTKPFNID